jgi:hypothetical protein
VRDTLRKRTARKAKVCKVQGTVTTGRAQAGRMTGGRG